MNRLLLILCIALGLSGCVTTVPQPITTTPPATALRVAPGLSVPTSVTLYTTAPLTVDFEYEMPAGTYKATYEDKEGYYFAAPAPLLMRHGWDRTTETQGGIYWSRGIAYPTHVYVYKNAVRKVSSNKVREFAQPVGTTAR